MKLAMLYILIFPLLILGFSAWSAVRPYGVSSLNNAGPHGLTEILYAYTSGTGNNGSAFAGLNANTPWWNVTLGLAMLAGRFLMIIPVLAIAGSMLNKKTVPPGPGTFPTNGPLFTGAARRRRRHRRRADLLPGAVARADRRALRRAFTERCSDGHAQADLAVRPVDPAAGDRRQLQQAAIRACWPRTR